MNENVKIPTWNELLESINNAVDHPGDTAWQIYYYMNANLKSMTSQEARTMLAAYMKMPLKRPSLIHSCMLRISVKMMEKFEDFRFLQFLKLWEYPLMLREEDKASTMKDGKKFLSLKQKVENAMQSYLLHHAEERPEDEISCIKHMVAVKMFNTQKDNRTIKSVKLVGAEGDELLADAHLFACKYSDIEGRLFDVLVRFSKEGVPRAHEIVPCNKSVEDVFPAITGYVEYIDASHNHCHIYDGYSRHFVSGNYSSNVEVGSFVKFSPVIPKQDKFKSAVIISSLSKSEGLRSFGMRRAKITYVDNQKGYAAWQLVDSDKSTPIKEVGTESPCYAEGYMSLSVMKTAGLVLPAVDDIVNIVVFLKRGKEGKKLPYVVYYERVVKA